MIRMYPGSYQIPPMRYHTKLNDARVEESMSNDEWCFQEKKDGSFYQLEITPNGNVYLFGRTISKKTGEYTEKIDNVPHIKEWAKKYLPNDSIILGEIYIPGKKSNGVTKIMGCLPQKAQERQQKDGLVRYYIFDCLRLNGKNLMELGFGERFNTLLDFFHDNRAEFEGNNGYIEFAETYCKKSAQEIFHHFTALEDYNDIISKVFSSGGEGVVFKNLAHPYAPDKRPVAAAYKLKEHVDSVDLIITKLLDPEKEYIGKDPENWPYKIDGVPVNKHYYYGWKNAVMVGAYKDGKIINVGRVASGFTDEMREDMAKNPENYLGKVAEFSCMSLTKDNALRHPVFERMRPDKDEKDCIWEEIFS